VTRRAGAPGRAARAGHAAGHTRHAHRARDAGASAVELAILAPALLFATMLIVQFALWFDARHAALAAAQAGARIAREEAAANPRWQVDAGREATTYYNALGTKLLTNVQVPPPARDQATNQVFVTVTGQLAGILPWHMTIRATVGGPVECFRPAGGGGSCG
jgi:Flp pilus assembly protein TadG